MTIPVIYVCMNERCGNNELYDKLKTDSRLKEVGVDVVRTGCIATCPYVNGVMVSTDPGDPWDGYKGLSKRTIRFSSRENSQGYDLSFEGQDPVEAILIKTLDLMKEA